MKKLIIVCFAALCSTGIFATPVKVLSTDATAKILEVFHHNFPEVTKHSIYNLGNMYMVYFNNEESNSSCRIYYDADGNVVETVRYYTAEQLSPFIRTKINSKYKGKSIFMVTDVANDSEHYYQVILQDEKSMIVIHANDNGDMYRERKYKRAA